MSGVEQCEAYKLSTNVPDEGNATFPARAKQSYLNRNLSEESRVATRTPLLFHFQTTKAVTPLSLPPQTTSHNAAPAYPPSSPLSIPSAFFPLHNTCTRVRKKGF